MSPLETVKSYFTALNTEDWDLMASVLHPELDLIPSGSRPRIGSDKAIAMFQKIFERFPVHQDNPTRFLEAGNTVVVEIAFAGSTAEWNRSVLRRSGHLRRGRRPHLPPLPVV